MKATILNNEIYFIGRHELIWQLGYFGKGLYSRSLASFTEEPVILMTEEAIFLYEQHGLLIFDEVYITLLQNGLEIIIDAIMETVNPKKLWLYRKYRLDGWTVKCGIKYGVDYILYENSPEEEHSE